jgi:hypothetical protein
MAPGFFQKVGDFFKKGFEFVKEKVVKPVVQTVKKVVKKGAQLTKKVWDHVAPFAKPAIQAYAASKGMDPAAAEILLNLGEGAIGALVNNEPPTMRSAEETPKQEPQQVIEEVVQYVDEYGNPVDENGNPLGGTTQQNPFAASAPAQTPVNLMRSKIRS